MAYNTAPVIVGVRLQDIGKLYHFDASIIPDVRPGDFVLVETNRGEQIGQVIEYIEEGEAELDGIKSVKGYASPREMVMDLLAQERSDEALKRCQALAREIRSLDGVKFVSAFFSYDGSLLTITYTAEENVELDSIRKTLAREFSVSTEMRRIGARDAAKLVGEYGACGSERCCSRFLTEFSPVSIKMAKAQGITLNPSEITGMCGRLRCCMVYEYEQYAEALKALPRRNKWVNTPHGLGKVIDLNPLKGMATVLVEDTRYELAADEIVLTEPSRPSQQTRETVEDEQDEGEADL